MKAYIVENRAVKFKQKPEPAGEKIAIKAIGVNRADIFHLQGKYPAFGLEFAGELHGKRVVGLSDGGAYAEFLAASEVPYIEIPESLDFIQAASLLEGLATSYHNLVDLCAVKSGEKVLIHGGASGIGIVAIQLAQLLGAKVFATAGKPEKLALIKKLGATAIDYQKQDFADKKYDVILDMVGADYFNRNLNALEINGRLAIISFIGGAKVADANIAHMLLKNLTIHGSTIRSLSPAHKQELLNKVAPYLTQIRPIIDHVFAFEDLPLALEHVEKYRNVGKVVVTI